MVNADILVKKNGSRGLPKMLKFFCHLQQVFRRAFMSYLSGLII